MFPHLTKRNSAKSDSFCVNRWGWYGLSIENVLLQYSSEYLKEKVRWAELGVEGKMTGARSDAL
jgi:hypothetical protein